MEETDWPTCGDLPLPVDPVVDEDGQTNNDEQSKYPLSRLASEAHIVDRRGRKY